MEECVGDTNVPKCGPSDCLRACAEISCEDCGEESEKIHGETIDECSTEGCEEVSSDVSAECETEIEDCDDSGCVSENDEGCVTVCPENSCEGEECLAVADQAIDLKYKRTRKRVLCEIRNPYLRRQKKRLARMRAISFATASRGSVLRARTSRITSKKLYNLLMTRFSHGKNAKVAGYVLKKAPKMLRSKIDASWKHRKQQGQLYKKVAAGKSIARASVYQMKAIPFHKSQKTERLIRKDAKLNMAMSRKKAKSLSLKYDD